MIAPILGSMHRLRLKDPDGSFRDKSISCAMWPKYVLLASSQTIPSSCFCGAAFGETT